MTAPALPATPFADVVRYPVRLTAALPRATTVVAVDADGQAVAFTAAQAEAARLARTGVAVFAPSEYVALARGVEAGDPGAARAAADRWSSGKRRNRAWCRAPRVELEVLDRLPAPRGRRVWTAALGWRDVAAVTWGEFLEALGLEFVEVRLEGAEVSE